MSKEMSWDDFEQMLLQRGWSKEDANEERRAQEHGAMGDCDGDMDL